MTRLLDNHLAGRWQAGHDAGAPLFDPVLGTELARVSGAGLDLAEGYAFARAQGGDALRALTYAQRSAQLARIAEVLQEKRDAWYDIALQNSGTTRNDSAVDIDGAIYTLGQYARWGAKLGAARCLADGDPVKLGRDGSFQSGHFLVPQRGIALLVNAFNFPAWGLWEKAAPALLSGVPVVVKPATATAWLTQQMVAAVIEAGVLPPGALSIVCGRPDGLIEALAPFDLVSFTGSADTARAICAHDNVLRHAIRVNAETDSLNSALLGPDAAPGSDAFALMVKEVVREMTVKSGQKCTAIRRVLVPRERAAAATEAIAAALAAVKVGNPRNDTVRMGALASRAQLAAVRAGLAALQSEAQLAWAGDDADLVDADPKVAACVMPHLLKVDDDDASKLVHDVEVFGPVATVVPYRDAGHAFTLARRGYGSLVASLFTDDAAFAARAAAQMAHAHGRLHVVTPAVGKSHTGHGNVMPMSLHGGPGRAGGGEELGGLRALAFYHQRSAVQAPPEVLAKLAEGAAPWQGGAG